jgi:hypothetical protein
MNALGAGTDDYTKLKLDGYNRRLYLEDKRIQNK